MKNDKKKIVFIGAIILTLAFIIGYYFLVLNDDVNNEALLNQVEVPELSASDTPSFSSKKEALDAIEKKRERIAPSVYDDRLLDSLGRYDPDLIDKNKQRMVDSIYRMGRIDYSDNTYAARITPIVPLTPPAVIDSSDLKGTEAESTFLKKMALEQQLFFAVSPKVQAATVINAAALEVVVDGRQSVRANDRLVLRTISDGEIGGITLSSNTLIYGIVKFKPNRLTLEVSRIGKRHVKLIAIDIADRLEGIYIRNSYREEALKEVIGDVVEDINIPGVPQVSGIKRIFQKNQRHVKVSVANNYRLLLVLKTI